MQKLMNLSSKSHIFRETNGRHFLDNQSLKLTSLDEN